MDVVLEMEKRGSRSGAPSEEIIVVNSSLVLTGGQLGLDGKPMAVTLVNRLGDCNFGLSDCQGRIDGVLKELRTKVPGCEDRIAELQIAKTKLAQDVEVADSSAITATKRVGDDAQATTTNMVGELDSRLSAKVADLLAQLQHSDEEESTLALIGLRLATVAAAVGCVRSSKLAACRNECTLLGHRHQMASAIRACGMLGSTNKDLPFPAQTCSGQGETRKLLADELTALCERLDQELSLVRSEMAESMERAAGDIRAEMQKLSASLSANIAESQRQSLDNASGLKAYREHTDAVLQREQKARTLEEERVKVAEANGLGPTQPPLSEADIWMRLDRLSELVQVMEEVRVTTGEMDHKITQAADVGLLGSDASVGRSSSDFFL
ncbi:unnamed protein product [Symbiodinium microadriaticum]|nr:unnamed protein product [Symbiodinium microadriaticum]